MDGIRIDPLGLFDTFGFASYEAGNPAVLGAGGSIVGEGVAVAGYDSNGGAYTGVIGAFGMHLGTEQNYIGAATGVENTSDGRANPIQLYEMNYGGEIPFIAGAGGGGGIYNTPNEAGVFLYLNAGALGQHASIGFGFSLPSWITGKCPEK